MLSEIKAMIRCEVIKADGIHLVANWENGGSDAVDEPIHTAEALLKAYPETKREDAEAFYAGKRDGFVIRHWTDEHGRKVVDTAYFPTGEHEERNGRSGAMHISDGESEISLNYSEMTRTEILDSPRSVNLLKAFEAMPDSELERFLQSISHPLSSLDLGERNAFKLMAEIESCGIMVKKAREAAA